MKKTIIALLALAGVAGAANTVEIDFGRYDNQTDGIYNIYIAEGYTTSDQGPANYVHGANNSATSEHSLTLGEQTISLQFTHTTGAGSCRGAGLMPTTPEETSNGGNSWWKGNYKGALPGEITADVTDGLTTQTSSGTGTFTLTFSNLEAGTYSLVGFGGFTGGDNLSAITISLGGDLTADWSSMTTSGNGWTAATTSTGASTSTAANTADDGVASTTNKGYYFDAQNIQVGENGTLTLTIAGDSADYGRTPLNYIALSKSVPEPATATLSLLALAGLCARRRRA